MSELRSAWALGLALALEVCGCSPGEPPRVRQFECRFVPASAGPEPLVLLLDTGTSRITFVNLSGRPVRALQSDRFSYSFPYPVGGGDGRAEIGRYDAALRIRRVAGGKRPAMSMRGDCKSVAVGAKL